MAEIEWKHVLPPERPVRRIETRELIETVRRVAREQKLYRAETILHLNLAAAELERLAYPSANPRGDDHG